MRLADGCDDWAERTAYEIRGKIGGVSVYVCCCFGSAVATFVCVGRPAMLSGGAAAVPDDLKLVVISDSVSSHNLIV